MNNESQPILPIKEEWEEYYKTLEAIRRTGVRDMSEGDFYLKECYPDLSISEASIIFINWQYNYIALSKKYNW